MKSKCYPVNSLGAFFEETRLCQGTIVWTSKRDGNGIVKVGHSGHEVYFDTSNTPNFEALKRGQDVRCEVSILKPDNILIAKNIEILTK